MTRLDLRWLWFMGGLMVALVVTEALHRLLGDGWLGTLAGFVFAGGLGIFIGRRCT